MGTFVKIFFGILLGVLGLLFVIGSPLGCLGGAAGFGILFIIGIAMLAGSLTLFIKVRR